MKAQGHIVGILIILNVNHQIVISTRKYSSIFLNKVPESAPNFIVFTLIIL